MSVAALNAVDGRNLVFNVSHMPSNHKASFLVFRAVLAIVLMIGFYLLALTIAAGLAWIPFAEMSYAHRIHPKLALICLFSAGVILWSIFPRIDKFIAPGPKLEPSEHPKFFKLLQEVAAKTKQEMPAEVYLCPEVNAWVMQRGGFMGIGSRRVMGVGLPLLQAFTISEFSAVLAHEFGHYCGGDTKLGPWIYKTRGMIVRTVQGLGGSWIQKPFLSYGNLFLRITHAISRRQEYLADELAARTVSVKAMISGLKKVHGASLGFHGFLNNEFAPVFNSGMRAPFIAGFSQYLSSKPLAAAIQKNIETELKEGKGDPYDTHPALKDRIAALELLRLEQSVSDESPALALIDHYERYEPELIAALTGAKVDQLKTLEWKDTGNLIYLPYWKKSVQDHANALRGKTVRDIYDMAVDPEQFANLVTSETQTAQEHIFTTVNLLGAALAVTLADHGWSIRSELGENIRLENNGTSLEPFGLVAEVANGKLSKDQWNQRVGATEELPICLTE